jgi:O-antigen ligase
LAPADFAAYLVIILISYWSARRNLISLAYTLIITPLALVIILLTGARGALFALPLVLVFPFVAFRRPFDLKAPIFLFTLILLLCLVFLQIAGNMIVEQRLNKDSVESGLDIRVLLSKIVFTAWLEAPLLGNGTGDTSVQIDAKFDAVSYPHNVLLEIANELGLIGLAPFLVLILFAINGARYLYREMRENNQKWYVVSLFTCFFYQFLLSFKTGSYAGSNMFYFFLGLTIALTHSLRYEFSEENIDTHRLFQAGIRLSGKRLG